jgi:hypothetical protein
VLLSTPWSWRFWFLMAQSCAISIVWLRTFSRWRSRRYSDYPCQKCGFNWRFGCYAESLEVAARQRVPFREQVSLSQSIFLLKAVAAAGAIVLITLELKEQKPPKHRLAPGAFCPAQPLLHLAELVQRELPKGGEGSRLCREIMDTVSRGGHHSSWKDREVSYRDRPLFGLPRYQHSAGILPPPPECNSNSKS